MQKDLKHMFDPKSRYSVFILCLTVGQVFAGFVVVVQALLHTNEGIDSEDTCRAHHAESCNICVTHEAFVTIVSGLVSATAICVWAWVCGNISLSLSLVCLSLHSNSTFHIQFESQIVCVIRSLLVSQCYDNTVQWYIILY